jgi:uncharacterized protein
MTTPLIITIFISSLLGSGHCVGMCGAFLAVALDGANRTSPRERFNRQVAYHSGRLITYITLGMLAGLLGSAVDLAGSSLGLQRAAAMLAGGMMILFALISLARHFGFTGLRSAMPKSLQTTLLSAHRFISAWGPLTRALAMGLLTTLLPCGWLYAFLIVASALANPIQSAGVMVIFWLGTLPLLALFGLGTQALSGWLRRSLPVATSLIVLVLGGLALSGRSLAGDELMRLVPATRSVQEQADSLRTLTGKDLPCCNGDAALAAKPGVKQGATP